jgi:outer membrane protein OmpA-like peptidoglycan-associated protein
MITNYSGRIAVGMAALTSLCLGGCETTNYDEQIATINSTLSAHDGRIGALEGKVGEHEARLAKVEKGKFNYQKVGEAVILFDTGSYALKPEESKLDAAIERLKTEDRNAYIEVEGFADLRQREANRELGLRRAREVCNTSATAAWPSIA